MMWLHLTNIVKQKESDSKEHMPRDSLYVNFKDG
jgi:hypothetical protein